MCFGVRTSTEVCDGRLNSAPLSISFMDSLASMFYLRPLPAITSPVPSSHGPASEYIVRWLELGKHEMEVTLILIQVFNGVFYLRVSLLSHFRWVASLPADCHRRKPLKLLTAAEAPALWCDTHLLQLKDIKLWQMTFGNLLTCKSRHLSLAFRWIRDSLRNRNVQCLMCRSRCEGY